MAETTKHNAAPWLKPVDQDVRAPPPRTVWSPDARPDSAAAASVAADATSTTTADATTAGAAADGATVSSAALSAPGRVATQ
mmetsp:Transcript_18819/g.42059  ORF Transcript_18819/g.42059 Transcript_18819/m.42059 type:complete len:82 (+) Transcript_18819:174-419(+)